MGRRLVLGCGVFVLLLIAAAAGGLWWLGSEAGLRFVVARVQTALAADGNELQIEGASGSLYRDLRIDRFNWKGGGVQASGTGLVVRWSPASLLKRRIHVSELAADVVDVRLPPPQPDTAPRGATPMPAAFGLPVTFDLERFAIGELRLTPGQAAGQPAPPAIVVREIGARLSYIASAFRLERFGAVTQYGRLADTVIEIADSPPHRLSASAQWQGEIEQVPLDLRLEAAGDLERLEARTTGRVAQADVRLDATLAPLATMPLEAAQVEVKGLDLKQLAAPTPLPSTRIDAQLKLAGADDGRRWTGGLEVRNHESGALFDGKIPLAELSSALAFLNADDPASRQLQLHDLRLTLPGAAGTGTPGTPGSPASPGSPGSPGTASGTPGSIDGFIDIFPGRNLAVGTAAIPEIQARLAFKAIDAALFAAEVPRTALDGSLELQRNEFALSLSQSEERTRAAMPAAFKGAAGPAEVVLRGRLDEQTLRLEEARIRLGQTRLQAQGSAGLTPPHEIALTGDARRLDLRQWLPKDTVGEPWRQGLISGNWSVQGKVVPGLDATLTLALVDSTLAGRPLAVDVRSRLVLAADWSPSRVEKTVVDLRLGENRLRANGALGDQSDRMTIEAAVTEPELVDPQLHGRVTVSGELTGAFDRLRTKLVLNGERLSLAQADGTTRLASVRIEASGPATAVVPPQAPFDVAIRLRNLQSAGQQLDALDLNVNGTLASHRFNLSAAGEGETAKLAGDGQATLGSKPLWQATLATTTLDGTLPMRLTAPAGLRLDAGSASLERFRMAVAGGEAALDRLSITWGEKTSFSTSGSARELPISRLLAIAGTDADSDSLQALQSLRLDANWNLAGTGAEDLSGDARVGLREVQAKASGVPLGLTGDNGARVVLKNGQMDGRFDLNLPSLAFSHRLTGPDLVVDGRLRLAGSVSGPLTQPQWHAALTGEALSVLQRSVGWRLADGVLAARFEGREFLLQGLSFSSGDGSVALKGQAGLLEAPRPERAGGPSTLPLNGRFDLTASKFPVPIGPGQRVALSGTAALSSSADGLSLTGKLAVDNGTIEIQGSSAPALPSDVTLIYRDADGNQIDGKQADAKQASEKQIEKGADLKKADSKKADSKKADSRQAEPKQGGTRDVAARAADPKAQATTPVGQGGKGSADKSGIRILTDLAVSLGDRLRVTGNGIAARLTGNLQVLGTLPDEPRLSGVINLVEGSYQSYGQNLRIDKGIVRFNGPVDNPALDITAKRPFLPVDAGIAITGTALNPVITLVSKPDMSETDKLSWLVLGSDPKNAPSAAQSLALREAARSLFVKGDGRYKPGIAERLGLDVMNFGYGSDMGPAQGVTESRNPTGLPGGQSTSASAAQQEVVTLGKRIGSKLFVSYEQGVRGLYNLLRIQYTLSQRLSLRAQSGSDNALDLMYSYSFD